MRRISWAASLCLPLPVDKKTIHNSYKSGHHEHGFIEPTSYEPGGAYIMLSMSSRKDIILKIQGICNSRTALADSPKPEN